MNKTLWLTSLLATGLIQCDATLAAGRDSITIVGSSTVYPFSATVAEQFGKTGKFKTPKVESTGTAAVLGRNIPISRMLRGP